MRLSSPLVRLANLAVACVVVLCAATVHAQPLARVFAWRFPVTVDSANCQNWSEPQIGPTLERGTVLTLGACPADQSAHATTWYIKRADQNPLIDPNWCRLASDSSGPFSSDTLNLWSTTDNILCPLPQVGVEYDIGVLTHDTLGNVLTWSDLLNFAPPGTPEQKWAWLIDAGYVTRFIVIDTAPPIARNLIVGPDCTPDSSVTFLHGDVTLSATVDAPDVAAVTFAVRMADTDLPWTIIERVEGGPGVFTLSDGFWNTELLNGIYALGAFAEDTLGNIDGDLNGAGPGPRFQLVVRIDNESPVATIAGIFDDEGNVVTELERGSVITINVNASDNFGVREVRFFYRHQGGSGQWVLADAVGPNPDPNWPFSFTWLVPANLVVGWNYELLVAAIDQCGTPDIGGADAVLPAVDNEANIAIVTIGGQDALTVPHVRGNNVEIVAHSEPLLDHVRFLYVQADDTTEIETVTGSIGQIVWVVNGWDASALAEGPAQICAVGSADIGGDLVTVAVNCRNIVIDRSFAAVLGEHTPLSGGLIGGHCGRTENVSVGLVMDYSGSMYEADAVDDMQFAAHEFLSNMVPGDRGAVIKFDDQVSVIQPFTDDLAAVDSAIFQPYGGGGTFLWDAIIVSSDLIRQETQRKALVLLTDGVDISGTPLDSAVAHAVASGAPIFIIGLGLDVETAVLNTVATATGGRLYLAPTPGDLAGIYRAIAAAIFVEARRESDDLVVEFVPPSDPDIDRVVFQYKRAADPNDPIFWNTIGEAVFDQLTHQWAYRWNALSLDCGLITLRVLAYDNAVPEPNAAAIVFADSVRVDNCAPVVQITNINGDVTPDGAEIPQGQVARIVASVTDAFGQGGNSTAARVDFYFTNGSDSIFIGSDVNGVPWETYWNTGGTPFGTYTVYAVAFDEAGNCGVDGVSIDVTDELYQRAWITGFDVDNGPGCMDHLWAVTDDCPPNFTTSVRFQYTTDGGSTWINLGEDQTGTPYCDPWLDYHVWGIDLEFESIPAGAIFRALATDEADNQDPNPPRFRFSDVDTSAAPVVYNEQWVRINAIGGQVPWVFSTLEDYTESCPVNGALVCMEPVAGDPTAHGGPVPNQTSPCNLVARDGQLTIFRGVPVDNEGLTYMMLTVYELDIHHVSAQGGSNGWLVSEDDQLDLFVPANGATGDGVAWFEPTFDDSIVSVVPPHQHYYTLISEVENVMSKDLDMGTVPSAFRFDFDTAGLPPDPEEWMVVAAHWNAAEQLWSELGMINVDPDLLNGTIGFQWVIDWDVSSLPGDTACPNAARLAVFLTTARPLSDSVHFAAAGCPTLPDYTYWTAARGPTTNCDPTFWATLRQGEFAPPLSAIDVYLDGVAIVNNGVSVQGEMGPVFTVTYDAQAGVLAVTFATADAPWFGCLSAGTHHIQIFADGRSTADTPFFVDRSGPAVTATGSFVNEQFTISAEISDSEAGVDIASASAVLANCLNGERTMTIHASEMTLDSIANGYRATFQLDWDGIAWLFGDNPSDPRRLCVRWNVRNFVCLGSDASQQFVYTIDVEGPVVTPIAPVGPGIDDDGDGLVNEDPRDCINNDGDAWYDGNIWHGRVDEDPVNFATDTVNCMLRPEIQGVVNEVAICGSGASGLELATFALTIDGQTFTLADTVNGELAFRVLWPYNGNDLYFTIGGPTSGGAADPFYGPGMHTVSVAIADSAGNFTAMPSSWSYYMRCGGPAITFAGTECGTWFNPEDTGNNFVFCVQAMGGVPIASNGISYEVWIVPNGGRIAGPTVVDPSGADSVCVSYSLGGSFPDGQTGIEIRVTAMNVLADPQSDPETGITRSSSTYWADNCAPACTGFTPAEGASLSREEPIVVEVFFSDDCPAGLAGFSVKQDATKSPAGRSSVLDGGESGRKGGDALDDNGSGIRLECFDLNIIAPNGTNVGPNAPEDYLELDPAHAKFILPAGQASGTYTVNVTLCDCVGNLGGCTWQFRVTSTGPQVAFCPPPNDSCSYQNYIGPNAPLRLCATVRETDGINTGFDGIRVDVLRVHNCPSGLCVDTLLANADYHIEPLPDPNVRDQLFTISGVYNFDPELASTELRMVVTATNVAGQVTSRTQAWVVDATPPVIMIVSPPPNGVVSAGQPVVISANFSDAANDSLASVPRGKGSLARTSRAGPDGDDGVARGSMTALDEGDSRRAGDALDANSGVDPACVDLRLVPMNGGPVIHLTETAVITPTGISWIGPLAAGGYTAVLAICDRVCNAAGINWNFTVIPVDSNGANSCIVFADPCVIRRPQHRIVFRRICENLDLTSLRLRIELQDRSGNFTVLLENAPVHSAGDSSWYDVNIPNFPAYTALRLTLTGNFAGGAPVPAVSHICVLDQGGGGPGDCGTITGTPYSWPNPFNPGEVTHFAFALDGGGADLSVKIYSFAGEFVRDVFDGWYMPPADIVWNGTNKDGEPVANGVYLAYVRIRACGETREHILKVAFRNVK